MKVLYLKYFISIILKQLETVVLYLRKQGFLYQTFLIQWFSILYVIGFLLEELDSDSGKTVGNNWNKHEGTLMPPRGLGEWIWYSCNTLLFFFFLIKIQRLKGYEVKKHLYFNEISSKCDAHDHKQRDIYFLLWWNSVKLNRCSGKQTLNTHLDSLYLFLIVLRI